MFKALAEDRLPDLLGARGAHRALVLIEPEAPRFEREAAILEQAAYLPLGVLDHGLVQHAVHAPRQHRVEMRHEADVVAVVAAEILEVVGEALAVRELLLEARETAAERVAAGVDDPGVGQDQLNESDIEAVVRHLVDEERGRSLAKDPRALEIALAVGAQLPGSERGERGEKARLRLVPAPRGDLACNLRYVGQLHRPLDLGMARQDLLDERRARTRQAEHEDRVGRLDTRAGALREE